MVRGLKKFIEHKIPDARKVVDIEQTISDWKSDNEGTAIIAIDFAGFYRFVCETKQAQLDVLLGKHKRSLDATETILQRFQDMGVQLDFFCGGPSRFLKNKLINKRRQEYLKQVDNILQMIKLGRKPEVIVRESKRNIYNNSSYVDAALMLAEKYGNVYKSYHNEYERDMALYASKHNAIAVISSNTDFILINGHWTFWDLQNFNSKEMTIWQIDKIKVRDFLELNDDELSLVGVLTGKRFPFQLTQNFLRQIGNNKYSFENVAKFIIDNFRNKSLVPNEIARILSPVDIVKNAEIVEETLKIFSNQPEPDPVVEDELSRIVKRMHSSYVYEFLNDLAVPVQPLFLQKSSYQMFMTAALEIHRRQMGIIVQHKHADQRREVICFNVSNIKNEMVHPIYPALQVPSLLCLYQDTTDEALIETKLRLLCWIASDLLNYIAFKNIPKTYSCAVLALVFMIERQFITSDEADCILYCLGRYVKDPKTLNSLSYPNSIAIRPFQLVFLYDNIYRFMVYSMYTVGLSNLVVYNQLDGVYFHQQFEKFINMPVIERDSFLKTVEVEDYRIY